MADSRQDRPAAHHGRQWPAPSWCDEDELAVRGRPTRRVFDDIGRRVPGRDHQCRTGCHFLEHEIEKGAQCCGAPGDRGLRRGPETLPIDRDGGEARPQSRRQWLHLVPCRDGAQGRQEQSGRACAGSRHLEFEDPPAPRPGQRRVGPQRRKLRFTASDIAGPDCIGGSNLGMRWRETESFRTRG